MIRVQLDYEVKDGLYSRRGRASQDKTRNPRTLREEAANRNHLKVVSRKIPIPDVRAEYVRKIDNEIQRCDLELATDHCRPQELSEKARAGFHIYAKPGETDRLPRIRDEQGLTTAILSL